MKYCSSALCFFFVFLFYLFIIVLFVYLFNMHESIRCLCVALYIISKSKIILNEESPESKTENENIYFSRCIFQIYFACVSCKRFKSNLNWVILAGSHFIIAYKKRFVTKCRVCNAVTILQQTILTGV